MSFFIQSYVFLVQLFLFQIDIFFLSLKWYYCLSYAKRFLFVFSNFSQSQKKTWRFCIWIKQIIMDYTSSSTWSKLSIFFGSISKYKNANFWFRYQYCFQTLSFHESTDFQFDRTIVEGCHIVNFWNKKNWEIWHLSAN